MFSQKSVTVLSTQRILEAQENEGMGNSRIIIRDEIVT